ncbi:MAG: hypothetical protein AAGA81_11040 [Acidobacteriota bacterium]
MHSRRLPTLLLLAVFTTALSAEAQLFKKKRSYAQGEIVEITGRVTDEAGNPVEGVEVRVEGSRKAFSYKRFRREKFNPAMLQTLTDANGNYSFEWQWHDYYNRFELSAVIGVRFGDQMKTEVLGSSDITERMKEGAPVVAPLVLENADFLYNLRQFESSVKSNDQRRIYGERGRPDKVEITEFADATEEAWWYFSLGATYLFRDGRLSEVVNFDPVPSVEERAQSATTTGSR